MCTKNRFQYTHYIRLPLPISQCQGLAYDGASNTQGHINGVASQVQYIEHSAIRVHYLAHCTNLYLQTVGRNMNVI